MGSTTPVVVNAWAPEYGKVVVEGSDGVRYHADLSPLSAVYCYPQNEAAWQKVSVDSYGLALVWTTRFEVHMDQIVGLALKKEPMAETA